MRSSKSCRIACLHAIRLQPKEMWNKNIGLQKQKLLIPIQGGMTEEARIWGLIKISRAKLKFVAGS